MKAILLVFYKENDFIGNLIDRPVLTKFLIDSKMLMNQSFLNKNKANNPSHSEYIKEATLDSVNIIKSDDNIRKPNIRTNIVFREKPEIKQNQDLFEENKTPFK